MAVRLARLPRLLALKTASGCKRCETACPTDFLSIRVYLGDETTRSMVSLTDARLIAP